MVKHVVLTKFAMKFDDSNPRTRYEEKCGWLETRMDLLHKYCIPSMLAQSVPFDWLFLVNPNFKGWSIDHARKLERYGKILYIESHWKEDQTEIGELLSDCYSDDFICTTRVDSDDIISNDFMLNLHCAVNNSGWYGYPNGYIFKNNMLAKRYYLENPFLSYAEYGPKFKSVFCVSHIHAKPITVINLNESWIQVDHGDNIKNDAYKKVKNFDAVKFSSSELDKSRWTLCT